MYSGECLQVGQLKIYTAQYHLSEILPLIFPFFAKEPVFRSLTPTVIAQG